VKLERNKDDLRRSPGSIDRKKMKKKDKVRTKISTRVKISEIVGNKPILFAPHPGGK